MVKESGYLRSRQGCKSAEPLYVLRATDYYCCTERKQCALLLSHYFRYCTCLDAMHIVCKRKMTTKAGGDAGRATVECFAAVRGQRNSEIACPLIRKVKVLQRTVIVERYPPLLGLCFGMPNSLGILGSTGTSFKTYSLSKPLRHCHNLISDFRRS